MVGKKGGERRGEDGSEARRWVQRGQKGAVSAGEQTAASCAGDATLQGPAARLESKIQAEVVSRATRVRGARDRRPGGQASRQVGRQAGSPAGWLAGQIETWSWLLSLAEPPHRVLHKAGNRKESATGVPPAGPSA
jgi:hypothetical protein